MTQRPAQLDLLTVVDDVGGTNITGCFHVPMEAVAPQPRPAHKRKLRRRLLITGAVLASLLVAAYLLLPTVVTPLVRAQLQQIVAEHLNAELRIGKISWSLPRTVTLTDSVLVARAADGTPVELLKIPKLRIELSRLPTKTTPLVIRRLNLEEVSIHLINTPGGWVGGRTGPPAPPQASGAANRPLSQIFELRQVRFNGASIVYEDRTRPQTVPLVWRGIDLTLNTDPSTNPVYRFDLAARNAPLAELAAAGSFHIDDLDFSIERIAATIRSDPTSVESPAPARLQQILQKHQVRGQLGVTGSARLPLKQYQHSTFDFSMKLENGSMLIPSRRQDAPDPLEDVSLTLRLASHPMSIHQDLLTTAQRLLTPEGAATLPATQRTAEEELAITAARIATRPATRAGDTQPAQTQPNQRLPLVYARIENARAKAGDNTLSIERAGGAYNWVDRHWQVYVRGALTSGRQHAALPDPLEGIVRTLDAEGAVELRLRGEGGIPEKSTGAKADYTIDLRTTSPRLLLRRHALTFTDISADFLIVPGFVHLREEGPQGQLHGLSARAYGGSLNMAGQARTSKPSAYDLLFTVRDVNLKALADERTAAGRSSRLQGKLSGVTHLTGFTKIAGASPLETMSGEGELEIVDGEFYHLPVLADIFQAIKPSAEGGTVGQAAGVFTIADRKVRFRRAAVAAPVLGVQGSGVVDFDGRLDFEAVAAPLADWKKQLQKSSIPLVGDVAAELAGGIQKILDTASGKLLYQFKITGTVKSPEVRPVAAPIITENVMRVFAAMIKGGDRLLDQMKGK